MRTIPTALNRKAFVFVNQLEHIHWDSTGKIPWSKAHAYVFVSEALRDGYSERTILKTYRKAHFQTTADVVNGVARFPEANLLWRCRYLLQQSDDLSTVPMKEPDALRSS